MSKWTTPQVVKMLEILKAVINTKKPTKIPSSDFGSFQIAEHILSLDKSYKIFPYNDTFTYHLDSKLTFGRFKGNKLCNVWKVSPNYIEWCMINADGFVIHPEAITAIQNRPVFVQDDLKRFYTIEGDTLQIDLQKFSKDVQGFRYHSEVTEEIYSFSQLSLESNIEKLKQECHPLTVIKGSEWGDSKALINIPRKRTVIILE